MHNLGLPNRSPRFERRAEVFHALESKATHARSYNRSTTQRLAERHDLPAAAPVPPAAAASTYFDEAPLFLSK